MKNIIFQIPDWYRKYPENPTKEDIERFTQECKECEEANKLIFNEAEQEFRAAKKALLEFFVEKTNAYKYVSNIQTPIFKPNLRWTLDGIKKKFNEAQEAKRKEDEINKKNGLRDRAIKWLLANGYEFEKHFTVENAIVSADNISADMEAERRAEALRESFDYTEFCGQNCDGPCAGWDGVSNRCDCGNRRVCWVTAFDHSFENPKVYAEAY